jgi:hypothetical protein
MRLAFWLMDRFGVSEPLVGDLLEERSRHRSALWQWRQTLVAVLWTVFPFVVTPALVGLGGLLNGVHSRRARLMPEK